MRNTNHGQTDQRSWVIAGHVQLEKQVKDQQLILNACNLNSYPLVTTDIATILKFLDAHPAITSLFITQSGLNSDHAKLLATNRTLHKLYLMMGTIDDSGAEALARNTTLTTLELTGNRIGLMGTQALAHNTTLRHLALNHNPIGKAGVIALADSQTLLTLALCNNQIDDEGAEALAQNKILHKLELGHNEIGQKGAEALAQNTTLLHLDLYHNHVGDEGARALAYHASLTTLNLAQNDISALGAKHFLWNHTLHMLDLHHNAIQDPIMTTLISQLSKLNPIQRFHYLHQTLRHYQKQKTLQKNSLASQSALEATSQMIDTLNALLPDLPKRSPFSLRTLSLFSLQKRIESLSETAQADFIASHLPNSLQSDYQVIVKDSAYCCYF